MPSRRLLLAATFLVIATALATMVTILNRRPPPRRATDPDPAVWLAGGDGPPQREQPGERAPQRIDRLASWHEEYAEGGSCKWRQPFGAPRDPFPIVLLVALLAYPALLGAAWGFLTSLFEAPPGRPRLPSSLGLVATGLVLLWLLRLDFVGPALELC